MRPLLAMLFVALPLTADGQAPPQAYRTTAAPLDFLLQTGFKRFLAKRPDNPVAAKILDFWESHPELEFRSGIPDEGKWAVYYPQAEIIELSQTLLGKCGIESHGRGVSQQSLERFISLIAPVLVHEFYHALLHLERHVDEYGAFEGELLASGHGAWFLANDPALATPEALSLGEWWNDEVQPLAVKVMAARRRLDRAATGRERRRARAAVERAVRAVSGKLAEHENRNEIELQSFAEWVAFSRSWAEFSKLIETYKSDKPRLTGSASVRRGFVLRLKEDLEAVRSGAALPPEAESLVRGRWETMIKEGIAFWSNEDRVAKARAAIDAELEKLKVHAGSSAGDSEKP